MALKLWLLNSTTYFEMFEKVIIGIFAIYIIWVYSSIVSLKIKSQYFCTFDYHGYVQNTHES